MNKIQNPEKVYHAVAWQHGDCLTVSHDVLEAMRGEYLVRIETIRTDWRRSDAKAFAQSVEWERLAVCMLRLGDQTEAVEAYREAALSCMGGMYYDYGDARCPCFALRARFCQMFERAVANCREEWRLWSLVGGDSFPGQTYRCFRRLDCLR